MCWVRGVRNESGSGFGKARVVVRWHGDPQDEGMCKMRLS